MSLGPSETGKQAEEAQGISLTSSCEIPRQEAAHVSAERWEAHGHQIQAEAPVSLPWVARTVPTGLRIPEHLPSSIPPHVPTAPLPSDLCSSPISLPLRTHLRRRLSLYPTPPAPSSPPAPARPGPALPSPAARADVRVRDDGPRSGLSQRVVRAGPLAPPPSAPFPLGRCAPLTREAAALAVAPAPLQHEEGVRPFCHPQRVGHQHLLRGQPHRGAACIGLGRPGGSAATVVSLGPSGRAEREVGRAGCAPWRTAGLQDAGSRPAAPPAGPAHSSPGPGPGRGRGPRHSRPAPPTPAPPPRLLVESASFALLASGGTVPDSGHGLYLQWPSPQTRGTGCGREQEPCSCFTPTPVL